MKEIMTRLEVMQQETAQKALFAGIKSNDFLAVSQALAAGADPRRLNDDLDRAPAAAAKNCGYDMCRLLLDALPESLRGESSVACAKHFSDRGDIDSVRDLLARPECKQAAQMAFFLMRTDVDHGRSTDFLAVAAPIFSTENKSKMDGLLLLASTVCDEDVITILAPHSNINARDGAGSTALMASVTVVRDGASTTSLLLSLGADANLANHAGHTPLMASAARGDGVRSRMLLSHCDPRARDAAGKTAADHAKSQGLRDLIAQQCQALDEKEAICVHLGGEESPPARPSRRSSL